MKQSQKNPSYSIAWFKIADCVMRGEKERALGVHRLLAHSLDDEAVASQLEGDIMFACGDIDRALQAYNDAAEKYNVLKKYEQAAGVYEHMLLLKSTDTLLYSALLRVYSAAGIMQQLVRITVLYIEFLKNSTDTTLMKKVVEEVMLGLNSSVQVVLARQLLELSFLETEEMVLFQRYLVTIVIKAYRESADQLKIQDFIEYLRQHKLQLFAYALDYTKTCSG
jgi:tetratricopeptide (TPR) repeat protein